MAYNIWFLFLASLDIESMFPSIPLHKVIEQAANILLNKVNNKFSKASLIKMFLFCTTEITFNFNGKFYQQTKGLSMGSPLAPILANLYFSTFEKEKYLLMSFLSNFNFITGSLMILFLYLISIMIKN